MKKIPVIITYIPLNAFIAYDGGVLIATPIVADEMKNQSCPHQKTKSSSHRQHKYTATVEKQTEPIHCFDTQPSEDVVSEKHRSDCTTSSMRGLLAGSCQTV